MTVSSLDAGWCGYRKKRTGGGAGYDHPSPSIPLPVEGRGKPMAMRPERLDVLAASVTDLQTVTCTMSFLKVRVYPRNAVGGSHGESGPFAHNAGTLPLLARTKSGRMPDFTGWKPVQPRHILARIFHSHFGKSREKPYEKRGANTFECVVEKTRHAGLETCDTAGWEACATRVCHGFAGFTMKYPG